MTDKSANVSIDRLPGMPQKWVEFLESRRSPDAAGFFFSAVRDIKTAAGSEELRGYLVDLYEKRGVPSAKTGENIERFGRPGTVVVAADIRAGLFGGPLFQFLKCLTAAKVCEELAARSVTTIPVGWMVPERPGFPAWSVTLADGAGELRRLEVPQDGTAALISEIEGIGEGKFDPDTLALLEREFCGASLAEASGRLLEAFLGEWGLIVLNPSDPELQRAIGNASGSGPVRDALLPVLVSIVDVYDFAAASGPLLWPQAGATIIDSRSRQTLEKYNLDLIQLYAGEGEAVGNVRESLPPGIPERFARLRAQTEKTMDELKARMAGETRVLKAADSCQERIAYQLSKMEKRVEASVTARMETAVRRIRKACNFLAPNGNLQERELAGIQLPLKYSTAAYRLVYDELDVFGLEHQLIYLD
ncbi:MAG: bacillithiol biosynthesis BshC [Acidobacteria bacterium]|nr:bacillithiol biosynthesis BshC [Acidobacteriota bacterium]